MRWEGDKQSENLEDRRGRKTRNMAVGGGAIGGGGILIVLLISLVLGVDPTKLLTLLDAGPGAAGPAGGAQVQERELTPAEKRTKDFTATVLAYTEEVWGEVFRKSGEKYEKPHMVLFSDMERTGCGSAPSSVGPFYCPADKTVYMDPTFFAELESKLGGSKAEFSQAYVIAHEVGHHVQNLLGYSGIVEQKRRTASKVEYNKWSVRLELQADYLAGVWAHYGQKKFAFIEPGDVESAMKSANAIGDDRLQKRSQGFTSPESYTHGTSAQRTKWFKLGLETGDLSKLKEIFELPESQL